MVLALAARRRQAVRAAFHALAARVMGTSPSRLSSAFASDALQDEGRRIGHWLQHQMSRAT